MALIGTIRKHSWILIVFIGLGLAGFVIMDMTSSGGGRSGTTFTLGSVDGEDIDYTEFQNTQNVLYSGVTGSNIYDQRSFLWDYFVEKAIIEEEAKKNGLAIGDAELQDLQFGNNLSPIISQQYINQATGQIDRNALNNIRQALETGNINPQFAQRWAYLLEQVKKTQLQTKLTNLVSQGIYIPSWMAELNHNLRNDRYNFEYVQIPFDEVEDSEVEVTDSDLKKYIADHQAIYNRETETRKVKYVAFNVVPTIEDSTKLLENMQSLAAEFETTENDSSFIERNYGVMGPEYLKEDALNPIIADSILNMNTGGVYGPYIDGSDYKVVKLVDKKTIPDSVESRHILRRATTQQEFAVAYQLLDSLRKVINDGIETFDSLAVKYSQDGSAADGGSLGWAYPGLMVKPFNDLIFFTAEEGELNLVITQFGVHLVEVTGFQYINKDVGYRLGYVSEPIVPSEDTQNEEYSRASDFVANIDAFSEFEKAVQDHQDLEILESGYVEKNDAFLLETGVGETSRQIIRWAFDSDTDQGDVSPEVYIYEDPVNYFNSKYLLVSLSDILEPGLASVESVRSEITPLVRNLKKGELLASKITGSDLAAIAGQFDLEVDTANNVTFATSFVPGLGNEPKVLANLVKLENGGVSSSIIGDNGVYMIKLLDKIPDVTDPNLSVLRQTTASGIKAAIPSQLLPSLRKEAKIKDNRFTYY